LKDITMRTPRSHILITFIGAAAVVGLSACVPSADGDKKSITTLDSLPVTLPPTSTTIVPASDAVIITAGTVIQPTVLPTLVPPTDETDDSSTTTTAVTATTSGATTTTSATGPGTYTIVAKDTLYGIAKKCAIGPAELASYNDWTDGVNHLIIAGQKIKMPCVPKATSTDSTSTTVAGATSTTAGGSSTGTSTTVAAGAGGTYTVQSGDFLSGIAAKTGTTVDAIVAANGWTDGANHVIFPGQVIKMPARSAG
jgi:LysM repeat protein